MQKEPFTLGTTVITYHKIEHLSLRTKMSTVSQINHLSQFKKKKKRKLSFLIQKNLMEIQEICVFVYIYIKFIYQSKIPRDQLKREHFVMVRSRQQNSKFKFQRLHPSAFFCYLWQHILSNYTSISVSTYVNVDNGTSCIYETLRPTYKR